MERKANVRMEDLLPLMNEVIQKGGKFRLTVTGNSMFPLFHENRDSVILEKAEQIKKHDILLYRRKNGQFVLHRVVQIKDGVLSFCGDNQLKIETPIDRDQVLARVCAFYRDGKLTELSRAWYRFYCLTWGSCIGLRPFFLVSYSKLCKIFHRN